MDTYRVAREAFLSAWRVLRWAERMDVDWDLDAITHRVYANRQVAIEARRAAYAAA